jgi:putative SOS response-associated peptidase YedK
MIDSFTILTCAPGTDCEPYHNRQPVILEQDQWATWSDLKADATPILRAGAANTIAIERAGVDEATNEGTELGNAA